MNSAAGVILFRNVRPLSDSKERPEGGRKAPFSGEKNAQNFMVTRCVCYCSPVPVPPCVLVTGAADNLSPYF